MKHSIQFLAAICLVALLGSCANSPIGDALEGSLQADPQLAENPPFGQSDPNPTDPPSPPDDFVKLPDDFPQELSIYPGSSLEDVILSTSDRAETETVWTTADPINLVQTYYQNKLQSNDWKIVGSPEENGEETLVATRDDLKVTIDLQPDGQSSGETQFAIDYSRDPKNIASVPKPTESPSPPPESSDSESPPVASSPSPSPTPTNTPDSTGEIPQELQKFAKDVAQLGIFESDFPSPNQAITRGEYARTLVRANNKIYANNPAKQIRLGVPSDDPVFSDVSTSHPNFAEIQGLAEAGLIPSSLSGDSTAVQFRPDAPLTREDMVLWKVPLDTRQVLPKATVDAVQERWGFQDAAKIDSKALRAVLADFDNGDNSNIRRVYGFTTLFQPKKAVTRAEAAAALWYFGFQGDGRSAQDALPAQSDTES